MATKPILTLEEKATILREHGVNVVACYERSPRFLRCPVIQFGGDENEGKRAASIMIEHGVNVYNLYRNWHYGAGNKEPIGGSWNLEFYNRI